MGEVEIVYRYEAVRYSRGLDDGDNPRPGYNLIIELREYPIIKRTTKGFWIGHGLCYQGKFRFVLSGAKKKFAHESKEEAAKSFVARKKRQIVILKGQLEDAERELAAFSSAQERAEKDAEAGAVGEEPVAGQKQTLTTDIISAQNRYHEKANLTLNQRWMTLYSPLFPWFGGKPAIAHIVWQALGNVHNYCEPFFGSGAVLFLRPHEPGIETVSDKDRMVSNFWRSLQADPDGVAKWADWPVNECDLHARHLWLVGQRESLTERLCSDPDYYDTKIAGWWLWGICCWIGGGWCSEEGPWIAGEEGVLVNGSTGGRPIFERHKGDTETKEMEQDAKIANEKCFG